jgi:hypothetical protein
MDPFVGVEGSSKCYVDALKCYSGRISKILLLEATLLQHLALAG